MALTIRGKMVGSGPRSEDWIGRSGAAS